MKIELKNVKFNKVMSEETFCFSATICLDGKRIGTAQNRGCGGSTIFYWENKEAGKELEAYAKSLPSLPFEDGDPLPYDIELLIDKMICDWLEMKDFKRWCKTLVVFNLKSDKKDDWRTLKPYKGDPVWSVSQKSYLVEKYGNTINRIINQELYGDPVL